MLLTRSKSHPWRLRANASVTAEAVGSKSRRLRLFFPADCDFRN